jgi:hypothetical protein
MTAHAQRQFTAMKVAYHPKSCYTEHALRERRCAVVISLHSGILAQSKGHVVNSEAEQSDWVDKLAGRIEQRGASSLALLLIEIARPFDFLGSQMLLMAQPLLTGIVADATVEQTTLLLDNPKLLNRLSATLKGAEVE